MSKTYIIVGAGLAGLFAARTLRHFGIDNIYVIEKTSYIGDLLQTMHIETHLQNGIKQVEDGFIYSSGNNTQWLTIEDLIRMFVNL